MLIPISKFSAWCAVGLMLLLGVTGQKSQRLSTNRLTHVELSRLLDCLTRKDLGIPLGRHYSGDKFFKLRYLYGRSRIGNVTYTDNAVELIVYSKEEKSALLYEVQMLKEKDCEKFLVLNTASLRRVKNRWGVIETGGLTYTIQRVEQATDAISETELVEVPISAVVRSCAKCEFGLPY